MIARHGVKSQRLAQSTTGAASLGKATLGKHLEKTRGPTGGAGEERGKGGGKGEEREKQVLKEEERERR